MDLPTDVLRTFVTAADSGSYTDAAAIVHRTQSAVSMQIKRLEELVERSLFIRNGRKMILTSEGQNLLVYARRILQIHDEAVLSMKRPDISGKVRIGAPDDYAEPLLPILLSRFAKTHPQVEVEVTCQPSASMLQLFDSGQLDLLIHSNSDVPKRGETICRDHLVWITSSKHLAHELDPVPLAVYNQGCKYRELAIKSLQGANKSYRIAYTSQNTTGIISAVKSGLAITVSGKSTIPSDVRVLGQSDGFPELPSIVITLIKSKNSISQAANVLAKYVAESFGELIHLNEK
ncbi:MAG: LysR substrate-binding domain-containing protein [Desulfotalea sp.]